jgi:hypothetical protein
MPFAELVTEDDSIVTLLTTLSVRPPTDPMERPWPFVHLPPLNTMVYEYKLSASPQCTFG